MQIKIELYGRLKAQFNNSIIQLDTEQSTIEGIYLELCQSHQVEPSQAVIKPILNDEFSDWKVTVAANDVIGLFPPAAGG